MKMIMNSASLSTARSCLRWPSRREIIDAVFWAAACWFPLAIGLMVQEKPHPGWTAAGLSATLVVVQLQKACGVFAGRPVLGIGLRVLGGVALGYVLGGW
jgi:hypothetical protein